MNKAFVIGCSSYEDPDITDLEYAHVDAERFTETLRASCGLGDSEIVCLSDTAGDPGSLPTRANVFRELSRTVRDAQGVEFGILFFYFSGHGFHADTTGDEFLLTRDSWLGALAPTALPFSNVVSLLEDCGARHVVLFLDACRSTIMGGKAAPSEDLPRVDVVSLCPDGMVTFCSCQKGEASYEADSGAGAGGIFTTALCEGLSNEGRCKTIYELDDYLVTRVPVLSRAASRPLQHPYSRVEPLGVQRLEIVTAQKRNEWLAQMPIGVERRGRVQRKTAVRVADAAYLGIDFGTTYSVISFVDDQGHVGTVPGTDGRALVPSVVSLTGDLDYEVGHRAVAAARDRPASTLRHIKRAIGSGESFDVGGRSIAPEFAASLILRSLRRNAEEALGVEVAGFVTAYPANFTIAQCNVLGKAFDLADMNILRAAGEPAVASILVEVEELTGGEDTEAVVIDLGGGTLDVATVTTGDGVLDVRSVAGHNNVGGIDYDRAVVSYVEEWLRERLSPSEDVLREIRVEIEREAERAKRRLGADEQTAIVLQGLELDDYGFSDIEIPIDQTLFRSLTAELNRSVAETIEEALERGGISPDVPYLVLLSGQGSKIFTVAETIHSTLPAARLEPRFQESAVGRALAYYAGVLRGTVKDALLLDTIYRDIGVRCCEHSVPKRDRSGAVEEVPIRVSRDRAQNTHVLPVLERDTTIPTRKRSSFKLDGGGTQETVRIDVCEFSTDNVAVPVGHAFVEAPAVERTFDIDIDVDANRTIVFTLIDVETGEKQAHQLNNLYERRRAAEPIREPEPGEIAAAATIVSS